MLKNELRILFRDRKNTLILLGISLILTITNIVLYIFSSSDIINMTKLINESEFWRNNIIKADKSTSVYIILFNKAFSILFTILQISFPFNIGISLIISERETGTLETLFYMPISLKKLIITKIIEIVIPSIITMLVVGFLNLGLAILFNYKGIAYTEWLLILLILSPSIIFFSSTLVLLLSIVSKSTREAYQYSLYSSFSMYLLLQCMLMKGINIVTSKNIIIFSILLLLGTGIIIRHLNTNMTIERILYEIHSKSKREKVYKT